MPDQPSNGDEGMLLPDGPAPDADLRAARDELMTVGDTIRAALAYDDVLAAGGDPAGPVNAGGEAR